MSKPKNNHVYRIIDSNNGHDIRVVATSVAQAAAFARRAIAKQKRDQFVQWVTDSTTGGWRGVSIDQLDCQTVQVPRPTPRPSRHTLPWKAVQAA
jgi:hypothetical protein